MRIYKLTILTSYIIKALAAKDYKRAPVDVVEARMEDGTIFQYLIDEYKMEVGVSILSPMDKFELSMELQDMVGTWSAHELGLENDGLCLLIYHLMEGIQRRASNSRHSLTDESPTYEMRRTGRR